MGPGLQNFFSALRASVLGDTAPDLKDCFWLAGKTIGIVTQQCPYPRKQWKCRLKEAYEVRGLERCRASYCQFGLKMRGGGPSPLAPPLDSPLLTKRLRRFRSKPHFCFTDFFKHELSCLRFSKAIRACLKTFGIKGRRACLKSFSLIFIEFVFQWFHFSLRREKKHRAVICRVSFIDFYLVFPRNVRIVFLTHTNTVILLKPYFGTIKESGLPVLGTHALVGTLSGVSTFAFSHNFALRNSAQIQNFRSWHCRGVKLVDCSVFRIERNSKRALL